MANVVPVSVNGFVLTGGNEVAIYKALWKSNRTTQDDGQLVKTKQIPEWFNKFLRMLWQVHDLLHAEIKLYLIVRYGFNRRIVFMW